MLYTGCILNDNSVGVRISVMSRHTLNDGVTPDPRITKDSYDEWLKELGPHSRLIGKYYRNKIPWEEFEQTYLGIIRYSSLNKKVESLAKRAMKEDITLLCIEEGADKCHRRILAVACKMHELNLEVEHL